MNALLIAGLVAFAIWIDRRRATAPRRRSHRPSNDALSHALRANESRFR